MTRRAHPEHPLARVAAPGSVPDAVSGTASDELATAQAAWELAPLLAGRGSVRLWTPDTGYDRAQRLGRRLPTAPAAIPIFDRRGRTELIALDFDPQVYGRAQVIRDADQAMAWVRAAGGRVVVDESTRGGRHVLVPLAHGANLAVRHLRPVIEELARRLPTLDIVPMCNRDTGCVTSPGSPCKEGGHRRLVTPLEDALDAAARRSPVGTVGRLAEVLGIPGLARLAGGREHRPGRSITEQGAPAGAGTRDQVDTAPAVNHPGAPLPLPPVAVAFARDGVAPVRRNIHGDPWTRHEARQSVLAHAAVRGWSLTQVITQLVTGEWPGLRDAYARYHGRWERALRADWTKAVSWANTAAPKLRLSAHEHKHTGGENRGTWELRRWVARSERWTMLCAELEGHARLTAMAVCRALAYATHLTGDRTVAPGRRWLSIAAGMLGEETVSGMLRSLRDLPGAPVLLVEKGTGIRADRYALVTPRIAGEDVDVPDTVVDQVSIEPVHLAAVVLGLPACRVLHTLDRLSPIQANSVRPLDLPALTGLSTTQIYQALARLAEHQLVDRGHGWVQRTTRTLTDVAVDHALDELRQHRIDRHRAERRQWHALLALWAGETTTDTDIPESEHLPHDPWTRAARDDYLAIVLAVGPPSGPDLPHPSIELEVAGPGFRERRRDPVERHAAQLLVGALGARILLDTS